VRPASALTGATSLVIPGVEDVRRVLATHELAAHEFRITPFADGIVVRLILRCRVPRMAQVLAELRALDSISFVSDHVLTEPDG
jgi:hypothetical protein